MWKLTAAELFPWSSCTRSCPTVCKKLQTAPFYCPSQRKSCNVDSKQILPPSYRTVVKNYKMNWKLWMKWNIQLQWTFAWSAQLCQWFHEWSNGPSQLILGRHFLLPFHKRWFSVSYANGSNKGSVEVLPFFRNIWRTEQLLPPCRYSRVTSLSGIFRSKMNFWNAPNGSNLCVIFTVILQKIYYSIWFWTEWNLLRV